MRFLNTILDKALIDPTFMFMTQDYHETQRKKVDIENKIFSWTSNFVGVTFYIKVSERHIRKRVGGQIPSLNNMYRDVKKCHNCIFFNIKHINKF